MTVDDLQRLWATNLKAARLAADLFQSELAERVGVTQQAVAKWERFGKIPVDQQVALAEALGLDVRTLFPTEAE